MTATGKVRYAKKKLMETGKVRYVKKKLTETGKVCEEKVDRNMEGYRYQQKEKVCRKSCQRIKSWQKGRREENLKEQGTGKVLTNTKLTSARVPYGVQYYVATVPGTVLNGAPTVPMIRISSKKCIRRSCRIRFYYGTIN
jgi:hypothetical protein